MTAVAGLHLVTIVVGRLAQASRVRAVDPPRLVAGALLPANLERVVHLQAGVVVVVVVVIVAGVVVAANQENQSMKYGMVVGENRAGGEHHHQVARVENRAVVVAD